MPRTILVSEGDSPLGGALARLLLARGRSVVTTADRGPGTPMDSAREHSPLVVPWNRRSPMSSRTLLLTALNAFPSVDEVLILEPPCSPVRTLADAESTVIEKAFDDARGPFFLAREVVAHFRQKGAGILCMVSRGPASGPLESGMQECFRGLAAWLLANAPGAGIIVNGFQAAEAATEEYAGFIERTLEEKARKITGRWFTYAPRGGLFPGARPPRRA